MKRRFVIIITIIVLLLAQISCGGVTGIEDVMPSVTQGYTP